ncbi:MAG: S41 family peptidase [Candidatus Eremiobacteraeota bacterium]|nr:S41 family peptidase [Candidatus Eremiobacteraeota bacterium]
MLDFLELQIVYTTILARYERKVAPRVLVDGARVGVAAALIASGIRDANLPFTPARVDAGAGEDLVDALVLRQLARYGTRLDAHRLVQAAVAGELAALDDPYSLLFRPQAFKKFNAFLGNETFGGIGAVVSFEATRAYVDRVLPGSPAERGGIARRDELVSVDGRDVTALGAAGLRDALRGKIGTPVSIVYRASAGSATSTVTLVRAAVRDPEVTTARFGDVAYVALSRFGDRSGAEVAAALRDARSDGARAVVFDLRANGGGYGDEATAVASAFLRSGPVFTTRERGGATTVATATGKPEWTGPLAVLVDGDTASAAEIVAGAVKDDGLGTIVGARTFGKGVVQSVFPLPDGSAVKLTTARYTTPNGTDIDKRGIVPDVAVSEPRGATAGDPSTDPQLARALEILNAAAVAPAPSVAPRR